MTFHQNYTLAQTIQDLNDHELALYDFEQQHCTIRPCLSITLFFKHGARPYVRQGLLNILNRYMECYGEYIKGGRTGDNRYAKKNQAGIEKIKNYIIECPADHEYMEINVASAKTISDAAEYSFTILAMGELTEDYEDRSGQNYPAGFDGGMLSSMRMVFPIEFLKDPIKLQQYQYFLLFACKQLPIRGGYAGLSMALADNMDRYLPQEYVIATQFSGLDIDSYWFIDKEDYGVLSVKGEKPHKEYFPYQYAKDAEVTNLGYIKGITWYNILPKLFFDRIGGWDKAKARLLRDDIQIIELDDDMLIIRAGETPQLGSKDQGLPEAYVFVNKVLKHLRNPESQALQPDLGGIENANEDNSRRWRARFDLEDTTHATIQPKKYDDVLVHENQPASIAGYYQDSATQKIIYLQLGEHAPSYPLSRHGTRAQVYIWHKLSQYAVGLIDHDRLKQIKKQAK